MEIEMKKTLHEGKNPFQCRMCDNTYSTKGNLKRHADKIHGKNESNQKSIKVEKAYASLSDNDEIEKKSKVATIREVIFCQEILEKYCYKIEHIPIVNLKKSSPKSKSQKSIEVREESNSLSEKHEGKSAVHDEKKHGCPHCDLKFSLIYTLENHIDKKHKENKVTSNRNEQKEETKYSKTINRKRNFIEQSADSSNEMEELSKNDLSKNMKVSREYDSQKFKCCACDQKLSSDFQLRVHYKMGNGIPMQCSNCTFKACTTKGLEIHHKKCNNGMETEVNLSKEPENEKASSSTTEATNPSEAFLQTISSGMI